MQVTSPVALGADVQVAGSVTFAANVKHARAIAVIADVGVAWTAITASARPAIGAIALAAWPAVGTAALTAWSSGTHMRNCSTITANPT